MSRYTIFLILTLCYVPHLCALSLFAKKTIRVHNYAPVDLYVSIYQKKPRGDAQRTSSIERAKSNGDSVGLTLPRSDAGRMLVFSPIFADLKENLTDIEFHRLPMAVQVSDLTSIYGDFYLGQIEGKYRGFNAREWNWQKPALEKASTLLQPTKETVDQITGQVQQAYEVLAPAAKLYVKENNPVIKNNPYKNDVAQVRVGNALSEQEKKFLEDRLAYVKKALPQFMASETERKIQGEQDYVPKIALIGSGGGYRAMLCTLGSLLGAQKIGLLDCVTWLCGLSGSTWAIAPWISSGLSLEDFKHSLAKSIETDVATITLDDATLFTNSLLIKFAFDQPMTLIDIFGDCLANRLFSFAGNNRLNMYLSEQAKLLSHGAYPLPLYTAISDDVAPAWYEYSPFEIGCPAHALYCPSWAFGRTFNQGSSRDFAPEQQLGFHLATFGSAFAATIERIYSEYKHQLMKRYSPGSKQLFDVALSYFTKDVDEVWAKEFSQNRFTWADVNNFSFGMDQSPIKDKKNLKLVDAGLDFNLPYPPVSGQRPERAADILIFLDASQHLISEKGQGAPALKGAQDYAAKHGLKFPPIDYADIEKRTISVFKDEKDPNVPVVIYMPRVKDEAALKGIAESSDLLALKKIIADFDPEQCVQTGFCQTDKFQYSSENAQKLMNLTQLNMMAAKYEILKAISWVMERKVPQKTP